MRLALYMARSDALCQRSDRRQIDFLAVGGLLIKGPCAILYASNRWAAASPSGGAANYSAAPSPRAADHCGDRHITPSVD